MRKNMRYAHFWEKSCDRIFAKKLTCLVNGHNLAGLVKTGLCRYAKHGPLTASKWLSRDHVNKSNQRPHTSANENLVCVQSPDFSMNIRSLCPISKCLRTLQKIPVSGSGSRWLVNMCHRLIMLCDIHRRGRGCSQRPHTSAKENLVWIRNLHLESGYGSGSRIRTRMTSKI